MNHVDPILFLLLKRHALKLHDLPFKTAKIKFLFFIYWFLLAYILAALVWWFIALNRQNEQMTSLRKQQLNKEQVNYADEARKIAGDKKRKTAQYIGEGSIFFLLIVAGAVFVYRAVVRELKLSRQQQNFMMAITHELKTPIAVAKLNLETLLMRKLDEEKRQKLLQHALQETNRLNVLCSNMLISSQIEAGGYRITNEDINISELVGNCVSDFLNRFPERAVKSGIDKNLFINGDVLLLQMAINNLVDNAIKYSPKDSEIRVQVNGNSGLVTISVANEGAGIDAKDREKIFEKFYRAGNEATRMAKGTGLGLYITRRIIETHKGKIYVDPGTDKGTAFVIELKQVV